MALLDHIRRHRLRHQERPAQIHANHPQPGIGRDGPKIVLAARGAGPEPARAGVNAGIVHQDMHPAHFGDHAAHRGVHRLRAGDIGDDGQHRIIAPDFAQIVGGAVEPLLINIQHRHPGAGAH